MTQTLQKSELVAALRAGVPLFSKQPEDGLDRAVGLARRAKLDKGETLFR